MTCCYIRSKEGLWWDTIVIIIRLVINNLAKHNTNKKPSTPKIMNFVYGYGKIHSMYLLPCFEQNETSCKCNECNFLRMSARIKIWRFIMIASVIKSKHPKNLNFKCEIAFLHLSNFSSVSSNAKGNKYFLGIGWNRYMCNEFL